MRESLVNVKKVTSEREIVVSVESHIEKIKKEKKKRVFNIPKWTLTY